MPTRRTCAPPKAMHAMRYARAARMKTNRLLPLLFFPAAGCTMFVAPFKMQHVAAQHAPADLGCPAEGVSQLHHASRLAAQPAFHGCGKYVVYHCMSLLSDLDQTECVPIASGDDP
jgi:hypothetical protein